jgi:hypothetical protein
MLKLQVDASLQLNYSMICPPHSIQKAEPRLFFDAAAFVQNGIVTSIEHSIVTRW